MSTTTTIDLSNLRQSKRHAKFATPRNYVESYFLIDPEDGSRVIECRLYWAGGMTSRARVWLRLRDRDRMAYGVGSSTGIGYDRSGAAIHDALKDAGVTDLPHSMSGAEYIIGELFAAVEKIYDRRLIKIHAYE